MHIQFKQLVVQFPGMKNPLFEIRERTIPEGSRLLIRGPSGAGKTTLLHIVAGLQDQYRGTVSVDGQSLQDWSESHRCAWRRETVGLIFQRLNLLGHLTAAENVLLGAPNSNLSGEKVLEALNKLGVDDLSDQFAYHLSLGEQQRVAVARVIARSPRLVLADEPTSSLDAKNAIRVIEALLASVDEKGTLIVATHDERVGSYFNEIWTLEGGVIR